MITAHLPAGYVLSRTLGWRGALAIAACIGAVFPDIDLFFFYVIDNRAVHHHRYWVHAPAFALAVTAIAWGLVRWRAPRHAPLIAAFGAGWALHILLDYPVGGIMWLWPMSEQLFTLVTVPATHSHWLLSFILHWTFLLEVGVWVLAFAMMSKATRNG